MVVAMIMVMGMMDMMAMMAMHEHYIGKTPWQIYIAFLSSSPRCILSAQILNPLDNTYK